MPFYRSREDREGLASSMGVAIAEKVLARILDSRSLSTSEETLREEGMALILTRRGLRSAKNLEVRRQMMGVAREN
jgi:hypothetical protein